jgi:DNA-binding CsgD family transcriptional regulator
MLSADPLRFPRLTEARQSGPVTRRRVRFIGRSGELATLNRGLARARAGEPVVVIVAGESGIGKSRLLEEFAASVENEATVLRSWCFPMAGAGVAFGPIAALLRDAVEQRPDLVETLKDAAADVASLLPHTLTRVEPSVPVGGELAQLRLLEACRALLREAARERPVVAVVEDVHWADRSSGDALAYLAGREEPDGLMFVVSYRSEDLPRHHHMHPIVRELERASRADVLRLDAFTTLELRAHLSDLLEHEPTEDLVRELADRSGGNPFFVEELVAAGAGSGGRELPRGLADLLAARTDPLSAAEQRVLRFAAAIGRRVHPDLLAASLDAEPDAISEAVRSAVDAGILVPAGEQLEFRHELLRESVYATLLPGERRPVHAAVARTLVRRPDLAPTGWSAGELAYHWQLAGESTAALSAAIQASDQARSVGALAAAARHGMQALELWEHVDDPEVVVGFDQVTLLMRLADDSMLGGGVPAHSWAERALSLVDEAADPLQYAYVASRLAHYELNAGMHERALRTAALATAAVEDLPDSVAKAEVLAQHAQILMNCDHYVRSKELALAARDMAKRLDDVGTQIHAGGVYGVALCTIGDWNEGLAALEDAQRLGAESADDSCTAESRARAALSRAFCLYWLGFPAQAHDVAKAGYEEATRSGFGLSMGVILRACAAAMAVAAGRLDDAEALLADVSPSPVQRFARFLSEARASLAVARGDYDEAHRALTSVATSTEAPIGLYHTGPVSVAIAQGRMDDARAIVTELLDHLVERGITWTVAPLTAYALCAEAEIAARCRAEGDDDGLAFALERARTLTSLRHGIAFKMLDSSGSLPPSVRAWSALGDAYLGDALAEVEDGPARWNHAIRTCEGADFPMLVLQAHLGAARCALASGDRGAAATHLREVRIRAAATGAHGLERRAGQLAERARIRLSGPPPTDADTDTKPTFGLTDRERQVLALVADAHTNREIGEALFMSPKTASVHVTNVLRKLDVASRREAARLARELGLV